MSWYWPILIFAIGVGCIISVFIGTFVSSFVSSFRRYTSAPLHRQPSDRELVKMAFKKLLRG